MRLGWVASVFCTPIRHSRVLWHDWPWSRPLRLQERAHPTTSATIHRTVYGTYSMRRCNEHDTCQCHTPRTLEGKHQVLICNAAIARTTISWQEPTTWTSKWTFKQPPSQCPPQLCAWSYLTTSPFSIIIIICYKEKQPWQLPPQCTASIDNQTRCDNNATDSQVATVKINTNGLY